MHWLESIGQDIRYALRMMRRSAGLTATAVLSLALGIGGTIAIFSVMYGLVLQSLPVLAPHQLVEVAQDDGVSNFHSYAEWKEFQREQNLFSGVFAYNDLDRSFSLEQVGKRQDLEGLYVSGGYFSTLGVNAIVGRALQPADDEPGVVPVCVIGYGLWRTEFNQSRSVLGRTLVLNGHAFQVVGVAPRSFFGVDVGESPEVFMTLESERLYRDYQTYEGHPTPSLDDPHPAYLLLKIFGRLKPGASLSRANAQLQVLGPEVYRAIPPIFDRITGKRFLGTYIAHPIFSNAWGDQRDTLLLLMLMAGIALFITCANLGNLQLARMTKRRGEIAARLALGATRSRLARQLFTENVALALAGGVAGLFVAYWGRQALLSVISNPNDPIVLNSSWDAKLVAFGVGITLLCPLLFGLAPAIRAVNVPPYSAMNNGSASGRRRNRFSNAALLVVQISLSMVVFVGAGLLARTVRALLSVDLGYQARGVVAIQADWPKGGNMQQQANVAGEMLAAFRSAPRVVSASGVVPYLGGARPTMFVSQPGGYERRVPGIGLFISSDYFRTRRTPLLAGRDFNNGDRQGTVPVAVLSDFAARAFFPGVNPVGMRYTERAEIGANAGQEYPVEIIGVAKDINERPANYAPMPIVYRPVSQCGVSCSPMSTFEVRFTGPLRGVMSRLELSAAKIDSHVALEFSLLTDHILSGIRRNRAREFLATFFAFFAGLLAMIGIYGVTSYAVAERRREIGILIALGAQPRHVFRTILGDTTVFVLVGIVLGMAAGYDAAQAMRGMLWGISPNDPLSYGLAACLMLFIVEAAAFVPALHASRADPMISLRSE